MQEIKVIISKTGEVTIDVDGIKGSSCKKLTKALEKKLGTTISDTKKNEYYDEQGTSDHQGVGGY